MGFGRYVGLNAFHHQKDRLDLFEGPESDTGPHLVDLAQSGVQVSLALGSGTTSRFWWAEGASSTSNRKMATG